MQWLRGGHFKHRALIQMPRTKLFAVTSVARPSHWLPKLV